MADPDVTAALGLLLAAWRRLPLAQQSALRRSTPAMGARRLQYDCNARTHRALTTKLLVGSDGDPRLLTPTALLMRSVGMNAEAAQAKRRYNRRRNDAEKSRPA